MKWTQVPAPMLAQRTFGMDLFDMTFAFQYFNYKTDQKTKESLSKIRLDPRRDENGKQTT